MRWSAIPYGLFCLLIFFPPMAGSSVINAIWVGVMLALYYLFSTLYNIPYSALQAEVVAEPRKRVFLYSVVSLLYVVSSAMVFCTSMIKSILMKNGIEEIWALRIPFIVFSCSAEYPHSSRLLSSKRRTMLSRKNITSPSGMHSRRPSLIRTSR